MTRRLIGISRGALCLLALAGAAGCADDDFGQERPPTDMAAAQFDMASTDFASTDMASKDAAAVDLATADMASIDF